MSSCGPCNPPNRYGNSRWAKREATGKPGDLIALGALAGRTEGRRLLEACRELGCRCGGPGNAGGFVRIVVEMVEHRIAGVDDDRSEGDAQSVLELERGFDGLVDGELFGDRDDDRLEAPRVAEHLGDPGGLRVQRSGTGGVGEATGAREE